jgi:hypothetical protein
MSPEQLAVVSAAKAYYLSDGSIDEHNNLMDAVRDLEIAEGSVPQDAPVKLVHCSDQLLD